MARDLPAILREYFNVSEHKSSGSGDAESETEAQPQCVPDSIAPVNLCRIFMHF
jgi:hypothetical protein